MPKLPEFKAKPIKGLKQKNWGKQTIHKFNKQEANYSKNNNLRFKPELILELAKPFNNIQSMRDFVGNNQEQIRSAGQMIYKKIIERPNWFIENRKNNSETDKECIKILSKINTLEEIHADTNYKRLLNRLYLHNSKDEVHRLLPHLNWKRNQWDDGSIYEIISQYSLIKEIRKVKEHKKFITKLQVDKGVKYPKSYALYLTMLSPSGNKLGSKRGPYKK